MSASGTDNIPPPSSSATSSEGVAVVAGNISAQAGSNVAVGTNISQTIVNEADQQYDVHGLANPYLGLQAYTYADRAIFAGRAVYIADAVAKLTNPAQPQSLLFVTGASGSGKSSFAQAGLLPALVDYYAQHNLSAKFVVFRPGNAPLTAFADALLQLGLLSAMPTPQSEGFAATPISSTPTAFAQLLKDKTPAAQINLLVIDQFEELLTQSAADQREAIFALLENLPAFASSHTQIIATMRVDYMPNLFAHQSLYDAAKQGIDLRAMNVDELKATIEKPLQVKYPDKRIEPELVTQLATEAAADASYLPLLQVTLEQLWDDGTLKLGTYISKYGNLGSALQQRAEDVYNYEDYAGLKQQPRSPADQQALLQIFTDLIQLSPDDPNQEVRCQRERDELAKGSSQRDHLIDDLINARLLSASAEPGNKQVEIDIVHESLIRNWVRLQDAIRQQQQELASRERFERAKSEWLAGNRGDDYLLTGVRLAEARELEQQGDVAFEDADAQEMLRRSIAQQEAVRQHELDRQRQIATISRWAAIGLGVLLIAAVIATIYAFSEGGIASQRLQVSEARRFSILARDEVSRNPQLALRLAYRAYTGQDLPEARDALGLAVEQASHRQTIFKYNAPSSAALLLPPVSGGLLFSPGYGIAEGGLFGVSHLEASPDGRYILLTLNTQGALLADAEGNLLAWLAYLPLYDSDPSDPNTAFQSPSPDDYTPLRWAMFSPDGHTVLKPTRYGVLMQWDISALPDQQSAAQATGFTDMPSIEASRLITISTSDAPFSMVNSAISPDARLIATVSDDHAISLWDTAGRRLFTLPYVPSNVLPLPTSPLNSLLLAFSPDSQQLLTVVDSGTLGLWNISATTAVTATRAATLAHEGNLAGFAFSPDSSRIVAVANTNTEGIVYLWDKVGRPLSVLRSAIPLYNPTFSPDGKSVAFASCGGALLWRDGASSLIPALQADSSCTDYGPPIAAISSDGAQIAAGNRDGLQLLNPQLQSTALNTSRTSALIFSPAGRRIFAVQGGVVHQYFVNRADLLAAAACKLAQPLSDEERKALDQALVADNSPPSDPTTEQHGCPADFSWQKKLDEDRR